MVEVEQSVEIGADADEVFALVPDVARKARLDPSVAVLDVVQETEGPVGIDTTFHYRLVIEGKLTDYRSRCVAFTPGRMMETVSDSDPPFTVRVSVDPLADGALLTQRESFALQQLRIPLPKADGWRGRLLRLLFGSREAIGQDSSIVEAEEARMRAKLQPRLLSWLQAIKEELESDRGKLEA